VNNQSKINSVTNTHPLSEEHFRQIIRRPHRERCNMDSVFGVTWNLRGRRILPLGTASMMVMSYHSSNDPQVRDAIELRCITAAVDPASGVISYNQVRMSHDFMRNPRPGARERVLDPRDEGCQTRRGDRPNGSWTRLALALDQKVCRAVSNNWRLDVVPTLPTFYAGFTAMSDVSMEITPALLGVIADDQGTTVAEVQQLSAEELQLAAATVWPRLWRAPDTDGNDTGRWLIEARFFSNLHHVEELYEDFTDMLGVDVWNPAREIKSATVVNPTIECARALNIDLIEILCVIASQQVDAADPAAVEQAAQLIAAVRAAGEACHVSKAGTQNVPSYDEACFQFVQLSDAVGEKLKGFGELVTDDVLAGALNDFDKPVTFTITDAFTQMPRDMAIAAARKLLDTDRRLISGGTTDADIVAALERPDGPLTASRLCNMQVLYRDVRMPVEESFRFSSAALGREKVEADLWAGPDWSPRKAHNQQTQEEVTDASTDVAELSAAG